MPPIAPGSTAAAIWRPRRKDISVHQPSIAVLRWTSSTSDYHSSADACIVGRMQKAASAVDADTSFRAAARTLARRH